MVIPLLSDIALSLGGDFEAITQLRHTPQESAQLNFNNLEYRVLVKGIKHHYIVDSVKEFRSECLVERLLQHRLRIVLIVAAGIEPHSCAEVLKLTCPDVGGHDNQGVLEVDAPPEAVGQTPLVHYL